MKGYIEVTIVAKIPVNRDSYPDDVKDVHDAAKYEEQSLASELIGVDDLLDVADDDGVVVTFKGVEQ